MKCRQISGEHHLKKGGDKTSINLLVYREPQAENRQQCTLSVFMKISKDTVVCIIDGMKSFPRFWRKFISTSTGPHQKSLNGQLWLKTTEIIFLIFDVDVDKIKTKHNRIEMSSTQIFEGLKISTKKYFDLKNVVSIHSLLDLEVYLPRGISASFRHAPETAFGWHIDT